MSPRNEAFPKGAWPIPFSPMKTLYFSPEEAETLVNALSCYGEYLGDVDKFNDLCSRIMFNALIEQDSTIVWWHRLEIPELEMPSEDVTTDDGYLLITTKTGEVKVEELTEVHTETGWAVDFVNEEISNVRAWARFPEPCSNK